jgi:hypothetical protein
MPDFVEITPAVLDALNSHRQDLAAVRWARRILEAAGLEVLVHPLEAEEAYELRERAKKLLAEADGLDGGRGR